MPIDTCKTVLQVEGTAGFQELVKRIFHGEISCLYQGAYATVLGTIAGHYPWFLVHNLLDSRIRIPQSVSAAIFRNALIGFAASAVSDTLSNPIRVVKTVKQAAAASNLDMSYVETINAICKKDGWAGLMLRGLGSRIITNGIQSIVFTIIWKWVSLNQTRELSWRKVIKVQKSGTPDIPEMTTSSKLQQV